VDHGCCCFAGLLDHIVDLKHDVAATDTGCVLAHTWLQCATHHRAFAATLDDLQEVLTHRAANATNTQLASCAHAFSEAHKRAAESMRSEMRQHVLRLAHMDERVYAQTVGHPEMLP
jgi:hypothetical protein